MQVMPKGRAQEAKAKMKTPDDLHHRGPSGYGRGANIDMDRVSSISCTTQPPMFGLARAMTQLCGSHKRSRGRQRCRTGTPKVRAIKLLEDPVDKFDAKRQAYLRVIDL